MQAIIDKLKKIEADLERSKVVEQAAGGGGAPSGTVVSETAFGQASSAGAASTYSRGDHTHGTPANPVTAHEAASDPHPGYLTDAEHTAIGNSSPHHAAVTLAADADALLGLSTQQITLDNQTANTVLAGPATGAAADPAFRALVDADIPSGINAAKIGGGGVSSTEFGYLDGVTSAIQTQLDAKIPKSLVDAKGDLITATADDTPARLAVGADGKWLGASSGASTGLDYFENPPPIRVKNTSGGTAAANDVGYLDYTASSGIEYKTTTTVLDNKAEKACVVVVGGANNADIYVFDRGRYTVPYTGSAPSAGDFMTFSSTAAKLTLSTVMTPNCVAIAQAAGSGGNVDVLLTTKNPRVPNYPTNDVYRGNTLSDSNFVSTIATLPGGATLTYGAVTAGAAGNLVPASTSQIGKMVLHNTTRGTEALISNCVTGTSTITLTANVPAGWQVGDTITIKSQTNTSNPGTNIFFVDFEIVSDVNALARQIVLSGIWIDTGGVPQNAWLHPYQSNVASLQRVITAAVTGAASNLTFPSINFLSKRFCMAWDANGAGTGILILRLSEETLAAP